MAVGNIIMIGGKPYQRGSAEMNAAIEAENLQKAGAQGIAAGTKTGSAAQAERGFQDPRVLARTIELERQADEDRILAQQRQRTQQSDRSNNSSSLRALYESMSSGQTPPAPVGGGGAPATIQPFPTAPPSAVGLSSAVAPIAAIDTSAAQRAEFGRAKDQVGQASQGALTGLRSALAGRGMLGSGVEGRQTARVATSGLGELGDVSRQQAITGAETAQRTAEQNRAGDITQREQDISATTAANSLAGENERARYSGAIEQRGQDIGAQKAANDLQMQSYLATMAQRGDVLKGLIAALSSGSSY